MPVMDMCVYECGYMQVRACTRGGLRLMLGVCPELFSTFLFWHKDSP